MSEHVESAEYIAVIGMAGRFPGAPDIERFWNNLVHGREAIARFTTEELLSRGVDEKLLSDPRYVKAGAVLEDADKFDAPFFGYSSKEAELMDPQQRVLLELAWQALESAGYNPANCPGSVGVFAGTGGNDYRKLLPGWRKSIAAGMDAFEVMLGNDPDFLTTRISYKLNLKGPSFTVQTACSSSLVAVHQACLHLLTWQCDMALAGGVCIRLPQGHGYLYQEGMIWSPDGHCRPFDASAGGTVFCNGAGLVVLKRLSEALEDNDNVLAVIRGSAVNNDGGVKAGFSAPSVTGQMEAVSAAMALAEVEADTIGYIEAHGTGTPLGDPIEVEALTAAFREQTKKKRFCALGSVKSNIGHLDAAAGIAGLIKTVLSLYHKKIPPTLHYTKANPNIDFSSSPFFVNSTLRDWDSCSHPRRAGVSSFGVGGTNAHIVLEEGPRQSSNPSASSWHILPLSARDASTLKVHVASLVNFLKNRKVISYADAAWTLQHGRKHFACRTVLTVRDGSPKPASSVPPPATAKRREVVFMFSGQGSQYVNMGLGLYQYQPVFKEYVDHCANLLAPTLGLDLREILYPRQGHEKEAEEQIHQTALTQPALFVIEYSLAMMWNHFGVFPEALVGHSIGEYAAACVAGCFSLEDALRLVATRGRLMQALPPGAMLAVPLSAEEAQSYVGRDISLAVVNSATMSVLSGDEKSMTELREELFDRGIEGRILRTSHAFHSPMMEPILAEFEEEIAQIAIQAPRIPFLSNLTGTWITEEDARSPSYWARHLRHTVNFFADIGELLHRYPSGVFLEVGPGRILEMLVRQHPDRDIEHVVLASTRRPVERKDDVQCFLEAMGRVWANGCEIDWAKLYQGEKRQRVALPSYPFERKRYWLQIDDEQRSGSAACPQTARSVHVEPRLSSTTLHHGSLTTTEQLIGRIWQAVIPGLENPQATDDFNELGGDSLQAVQMLTEVEKQTGMKMLPGDIARAPVLRDFAMLVEQRQKAASPGTNEPTPAVSGSPLPVKLAKALRNPGRSLPKLRAFLRGTAYILRYRLTRRDVVIRFPFFAYTKVDIRGPGKVRIDRNCGAYSNGLEHVTILTTNTNAKVKIGRRCDLAGLTIRCQGTITLGDRVLTARNLIQDFFLDPAAKRGSAENAINIADDTWLAMQSTVLAGSSIGRGAVLAALSTVYRAEVAENLVAFGNPVLAQRNPLQE